MKNGALVLGIIGGLISLLYGLVGYGLGGIASGWQGGVIKILSLGLPIAALVGAGMVSTKPMLGAKLMGGAAVGMVLILGFNFFSLIPVVLLGLGAYLGYMGSQEDAKKALQPMAKQSDSA